MRQSLKKNRTLKTAPSQAPFDSPFETQGKQGKPFEAQGKRVGHPQNSSTLFAQTTFPIGRICGSLKRKAVATLFEIFAAENSVG
jgi:hypothetical protein